jgi:mono/diheme cytochrome c family protein
MKKIFQYLMMLTLSLMATSCYYDELPYEAPAGELPETVSYQSDIQPLWDQSCISCHKPGQTAPDLTAANSYLALTKNNKYVVAGNAASSILHKSLIGEGAPLMPTSGKWSDAKIALVDKWINDGALNN